MSRSKIQKSVAAVLCLIALLGACSGEASYSTNPPPGEEEIAASTAIGRASAIQMCELDGNAALTESDFRSLLKDTVGELQTKPISDWLMAPNHSIPLTKHMPTSVFYNGIAGESESDRSVMITGYGLGWNEIHAEGIIWSENGAWSYQAYPDAKEPVINARKNIFAQSNICRGIAQQVLQQGDYMAVKVYMGQTKGFEEVHLLHFANGEWELIWAPTYEEYARWQDIPLASVEFTNGINEFIVHRGFFNQPDIKEWDEVWRLDGGQYKRISSSRE